ncbi:MAG: GlsB/YeaQ/YmgE family stress response membrane protein [Mycobacteriales bacterium]
MILAVFLILLAIVVIMPVIGYALWLIVTTIITGIFIGALARLVVPGRQPIGLVATIVSGLFGSFVGSLIGYAAWGKHGHGFARVLIEIGLAAIIVAILSAALRRDQRVYSRVAPRSHQGHKVIDV